MKAAHIKALNCDDGTTQPPSLKPRVGSSFGPPGACITPSSDTNAPVMTFLFSVLHSSGETRISMSLDGFTDGPNQSVDHSTTTPIRPAFAA